MRRLGAFPVNVDRPGPGAIRHCRDLIRAGRTLVVFPEGTIYYYGPGEVHPLKPGAAWLALPGRRWAPEPPPLVVPIRLVYGDRRLRFRSRIEVVVGEPIDPADYRHLPRKDAIRAMTSDLQSRLGDRVNDSSVERYPACAFLARADGRTEARDGGPVDRKAWLRALGPEARAEIRRLHRLRPAWNLVLLLYPAVWAAGAALGRRRDLLARPPGRLCGGRRRGACAGDADARGHPRHAVPPPRPGSSRRIPAGRAGPVLDHGLQGGAPGPSPPHPDRATPTTSSTSRPIRPCDRRCSTPGWRSACSPT